MDLSDLRKGDQLATAPAIRPDPLPVDPAGSVGVAAHLEVFAQLFVADRPSLVKELLDLLEDQSVALDRRRVMGLLEPDAAPDSLRLVRGGEPSQSLAKLADLDFQPLVDICSCWSSPTRLGLVWLRHGPIVPNNFSMLFGL
jgi:hypothetical protein